MNENNQKAFFSCSAKIAAQFSGAILFVSFLIFCIGYSIGYRSALRESLREIQKESLAQEIYANAFFINNQGHSELDGNASSFESLSAEDELNNKEEEPQNKVFFTARLIGYPETHKKYAVQFIEKWKKRGINLIIKEYGTSKAKNKRWVQVLLEPNIDKIQAELLANIISKEENLADVIVELYSSEEKTV